MLYILVLFALNANIAKILLLPKISFTVCIICFNCSQLFSLRTMTTTDANWRSLMLIDGCNKCLNTIKELLNFRWGQVQTSLY